MVGCFQLGLSRTNYMKKKQIDCVRGRSTTASMPSCGHALIDIIQNWHQLFIVMNQLALFIDYSETFDQCNDYYHSLNPIV